jgi:hypothetical protein
MQELDDSNISAIHFRLFSKIIQPLQEFICIEKPQPNSHHNMERPDLLDLSTPDERKFRLL